jgi:hypothetical protein
MRGSEFSRSSDEKKNRDARSGDATPFSMGLIYVLRPFQEVNRPVT